MPERNRYRPCVGLVLLNDADEVWVGRRIDHPSRYWQMPQGGIEPEEKPIDAAWREMREEIGTAKARLLFTHPRWLRYELPADLAKSLWGARYCGQQQKWFVFRFLGSDADIRIDTETPEFSAWRWLPVLDLEEVIVPFKRHVYREIVRVLQKQLDRDGVARRARS